MKKKILIVEDDPTTQLLHRIYIEDIAEVVTSDDGLAALELLETGVNIDAIITDHEMPRFTGKQLIEKLRAPGSPFAGIPVIMATASITKEEMSGYSIDFFFHKPVTLEEMRKATRLVLKT